MLETIEIVVGTYDEFLLGYKINKTNNVLSLEQTFANHSHAASIRCVTSYGKVMASGGADDAVFLYDLEERRETSALIHHSGTVSCLEFTPKRSYLMTGGEDGMLALCRSGTYRVEKMWEKAHKGSGVLGMSIHPSGKLALTVGTDATLKTWNLVTGRQAYSINLLSKKNGGGWQIIGVHWNPSGKLYGVGMFSKVDIYSVDSAGIIFSTDVEERINCFFFVNDYTFAVGCDGGFILLCNVNHKNCLYKVKAHEDRVKCLFSLKVDGHVYLASASSGGEIKLWEFTATSLLELAKVNTGCRITCLNIAEYGYYAKVKKEESVDESLLDEKKIEELSKYVLNLRDGGGKGNRNETVTVEIEEEVVTNHLKKTKTKHSVQPQGEVEDNEQHDDDDDEAEEIKKLAQEIEMSEVNDDEISRIKGLSNSLSKSKKKKCQNDFTNWEVSSLKICNKVKEEEISRAEYYSNSVPKVECGSDKTNWGKSSSEICDEDSDQKIRKKKKNNFKQLQRMMFLVSDVNGSKIDLSGETKKKTKRLQNSCEVKLKRKKKDKRRTDLRN